MARLLRLIRLVKTIQGTDSKLAFCSGFREICLALSAPLPCVDSNGLIFFHLPPMTQALMHCTS